MITFCIYKLKFEKNFKIVILLKKILVVKVNK